MGTFVRLASGVSFGYLTCLSAIVWSASAKIRLSHDDAHPPPRHEHRCADEHEAEKKENEINKNAHLLHYVEVAASPTHRLYLELRTPLAAQPMPNRIQPLLVLNSVRKPNSPTATAMPCHPPRAPFQCERCRLSGSLSSAPVRVSDSFTPAPHFLLEPPLPCLPSVLAPWPPPCPWPAFSLLALAAIAARLEKSSCCSRRDPVRVTLRDHLPRTIGHTFSPLAFLIRSAAASSIFPRPMVTRCRLPGAGSASFHVAWLPEEASRFLRVEGCFDATRHQLRRTQAGEDVPSFGGW